MKLAILLSVLCGCQSGHLAQDSCAELDQYAPAGVSLGSNEAQCAEVLAFAETVQARYGMDFPTWMSTVLPQRGVLVEDALFALIGKRAWTPRSFGPVPAEVPCGKGIPLTDELWATDLSQILTARPEKLFVSLGIEIPPYPGDMAAIRVSQNFDCDETVGVMEIVGEFHVGLPLLAGGWTLVSSSVPSIEE